MEHVTSSKYCSENVIIAHFSDKFSYSHHKLSNPQWTIKQLIKEEVGTGLKLGHAASKTSH